MTAYGLDKDMVRMASIYMGHMSASSTDASVGIRPMISLKPGQVIIDGTGIESDPWEIQS